MVKWFVINICFLAKEYHSVLYYSFIQPYVAYAMGIWGNTLAKNIHEVQRLVQRLVTKYVSLLLCFCLPVKCYSGMIMIFIIISFCYYNGLINYLIYVLWKIYKSQCM